ncbi:MAG: hemolysin family protein, partial [Muribaculaceae bacterium]|nr:hemolysin family protein [Muribaculaceae bacterium]
MTSWIIIALVSLLFSDLFSGFEIAYVSADRVRAELDVQKGGLAPRLIERYYRNPDFFISTLLVGNNIVLVVYGMAAAALLEPWLSSICNNEAFILIMQTLISTAVILISGEFFPKTVFRINPNRSLKLFALPIYLFYLILYPISMFATWLSRMLMKLFGIKSDEQRRTMLSLVDLNQYIERTIDEQTDTDEQHLENEVKIFHNAIDFSTIHLRDCMIPRNEIVAVNIATTTAPELAALFTSTGRSKIIVYDDDIDNVLGYIHVSELFRPEVDWKQQLKPVVFAPEALLATTMMKRLLHEKRSLAIVVDEFGGTSGMVTLEDLV